MADIPTLLKGAGNAVNFLRAAFDKGIGITKALQDLRSGGLSIADNTARQIYNYLSGPLNTGREYVNNLSLESLPRIDKLAPSLTSTLRNFSYVVQVTGQHNLTGETIQRYVTISTNSLLTKQEAIDEAEAIASGSGDAYGVDNPESEVVDVLQNSAGLV